jgi:outer membrane receptor protein involved in Fe transport
VLPLTETSKIESGVQSIVRGSSNNFSYFENQNGNWVEDISQKDEFIYNEQIHSLYGLWSGGFGKFSAEAGMRLEQTFIDGEQTVNNQQINQNYFNLYPSLSLMRETEKDASFVLSYSRRVNRPTARMLNPFENISNPEVIRSGNPDLQPEYLNSVELGYSKSWKKTNIGASVFYYYINNVINQVNELDSAGVSHMYPINADWAQSYGMELTFDQMIAKWWKINGSATIFRNNVHGYSDEENSNYSYNGRINSTWTMAKNLTIQLTGYYSKPAVGLYASIDPQTSFDIALKKEFTDKLSVTLRATDIFNTLKSSYTSWGDDFTTDNWRKTETRVVYFSLSYKFGGGEIFKKQKVKNEVESKPTLEMF